MLSQKPEQQIEIGCNFQISTIVTKLFIKTAVTEEGWVRRHKPKFEQVCFKNCTVDTKFATNSTNITNSIRGNSSNSWQKISTALKLFKRFKLCANNSRWRKLYSWSILCMGLLHVFLKFPDSKLFSEKKRSHFFKAAAPGLKFVCRPFWNIGDSIKSGLLQSAGGSYRHGAGRRPGGRALPHLELRLLVTGASGTGQGRLARGPHEAPRSRPWRVYPAAGGCAEASANPGVVVFGKSVFQTWISERLAFDKRKLRNA